MKKHFITGVLLLAVTAGGFSTFTSCKDTDEDLYTELNSQQVSLKAALEALKTQCENCSTNCATKISELETLIGNLPEDTDKTSIVEWVKELLAKKADKNTVDNILEILNGNGNTPGLIDRVTALEGKTGPFDEADVEDIKELLTLKPKLEGLFDSDGNLKVQVEIDAINKVLYGEDGQSGLIKEVGDLSKWFEDCGWKDGAEFQNLVNQGQFIISNKLALEYLLEFTKDDKYKLNKDAIKALNEVYSDLAGIQEMYKNIYQTAQLPEGETAWWNYGEVMQKIKDNSAAIEKLQEDVDMLFNRLNDMVTSLILQASHNSIFGGFNTPFGINSMVLMTCYGERATSANTFPVSGVAAECYSQDNDDIDWSSITSEAFSVPGTIVSTNAEGKATLGNFWFTVNPGTVRKVDLDGFALVNSRDDDPAIEVINVAKDNETVLKFGIGARSENNGNGLYQAEAVVPVEKLADIKVNIEPGLVQALKDAVQNRTASDAATLLKKVYQQLQNICDANALRYTYEAATGKDTQGNWIKEDQKVYSNYGMAATAYKPLSFATLKGTSIRHIPTFGSIEINKDMVDLDLGKFTVDGNNFSLKLNFGKPEFKDLSEIKVPVKLTGTVEGSDGNETVTIEDEIDITDQAQEIQDNLIAAIDEWLEGKPGEPSLDDRVQEAIWYALFNAPKDENDPEAVDPKYPYDPKKPIGVVADLVKQVNDMMGGIQDKLDNLVDQINKDYLGKVNTLIDKYNAIANRVNKVLDDPNHYLQSVLLYRKAGKLALNGTTPEVELPFGILSTDPSAPTIFKGTGEAISLWATTYNFETLAPAFKKIVGVVKVTDKNGNPKPELAKTANATLAKILDNGQYRVALNVKGAADGDRYEVAYQALDYTGHTSTVKCYIMIAR